jgi:hypothetical protein
MTSFYFNELSAEAQQRAIIDYRKNIDYSIDTPLDNDIDYIIKVLDVNYLQLSPRRFIFDYSGTNYTMEVRTLKGKAMIKYIEKHFLPCNDAVFNNVLARYRRYVDTWECVNLDDFITAICEEYNELKNSYYDIIASDNNIIKEFETNGTLFTIEGEQYY